MSQQEEFEKKEETQAQPAENLTEEVLNEPISEQEAVEIPATEPGKENAEVPPVPPYPAPNPVPPVAPVVKGKKGFVCPYLGSDPVAVKHCPHVKNLTVCKVLLWIIAGVLELVLLGFAIFGVYSMVRPGGSVPSGGNGGGITPPSGFEIPDLWGGDEGAASSEDSSSENIKENTRTRAQMGLGCREIDAMEADYYGVEPGLMILQILDGSPAKGKDVQVYDIITAMDGTSILTMEDYYKFMEDKVAGDTVELTLCRPGETEEENETVKVKITFTKNDSYDEEAAGKGEASESTNSFPKF